MSLRDIIIMSLIIFSCLGSARSTGHFLQEILHKWPFYNRKVLESFLEGDISAASISKCIINFFFAYILEKSGFIKVSKVKKIN